MSEKRLDCHTTTSSLCILHDSCTHETEGGKSFLAQYLINKDILHPQLQGYVENVNKWSKKDYLEATDGVARLRSIVDDIARQYTAIIAPSTADEAPLVGLPKDYSGIIVSFLTVAYQHGLSLRTDFRLYQAIRNYVDWLAHAGCQCSWFHWIKWFACRSSIDRSPISGRILIGSR